MPVATDAKKGQVLKMDGKYFLVIDHELRTPGNKRGFVTFRLRDLDAGSVTNKKVMSDSAVELIDVDKQPAEYLYKDGSAHVFMNRETFDQFEISGPVVEEALPYMLHNQEIAVNFLEGRAVAIDLPSSVNLLVIEAGPSARGNTAQGVTKKIKLETGLELNAPHFIEVGEKVKIDTRTGEFISRG